MCYTRRVSQVRVADRGSSYTRLRRRSQRSTAPPTASTRPLALLHQRLPDRHVRGAHRRSVRRTPAAVAGQGLWRPAGRVDARRVPVERLLSPRFHRRGGLAACRTRLVDRTSSDLSQVGCYLQRLSDGRCVCQEHHTVLDEWSRV